MQSWQDVRLYAKWLIKQFKITIETTENGHSLINGVALTYGGYDGTNATFGTNPSLSLILKAYNAEGGFQFSGVYTISTGLERTVKFYEKIEFEIQMAKGHYLSSFTLSREGASGGGGYTWDHANQTISGSRSIALGRGDLDEMGINVGDYDSANAVNNVLATMNRVTDSYTITVDFARQWYLFTVVKMVEENGTLKENPNHIELKRPYNGVVTDGDLDKGLAFHNVAGYFTNRECTEPFNAGSYTVVKDVFIYIKYTPSNDVSHEAKFYGWTKSGYTKLETGKDYVGAYIDNGVTYINGQGGRQWSTAINGLTIVKLPTPTSVYWPDRLAAYVDEYGNLQYVNTGFVLAYWVKISGGASINTSAPITPYVLKNSGLKEGTHYSIVVPGESQIDATGCTIYAVYESIDKTFDMIDFGEADYATKKSDVKDFTIGNGDFTRISFGVLKRYYIDIDKAELLIARTLKNGGESEPEWETADSILLNKSTDTNYLVKATFMPNKDGTYTILGSPVTNYGLEEDKYIYYFKIKVTTSLGIVVYSNNEAWACVNDRLINVSTSVTTGVSGSDNVTISILENDGGNLKYKASKDVATDFTKNEGYVNITSSVGMKGGYVSFWPEKEDGVDLNSASLMKINNEFKLVFGPKDNEHVVGIGESVTFYFYENRDNTGKSCSVAIKIVKADMNGVTVQVIIGWDGAVNASVN